MAVRVQSTQKQYSKYGRLYAREQRNCKVRTRRDTARPHDCLSPSHSPVRSAVLASFCCYSGSIYMRRKNAATLKATVHGTRTHVRAGASTMHPDTDSGDGDRRRRRNVSTRGLARWTVIEKWYVPNPLLDSLYCAASTWCEHYASRHGLG